MNKISVTSLSGYLYCPRKLYIEQVLKIVKFPKKAMVKGTIRHSTYEMINKYEEDLVELILPGIMFKDIQSNYIKKYSQILKTSIIRNKNLIHKTGLDMVNVFKEAWPSVKNEAIYRANNSYLFSKKTELFGMDLWDAIIPKIQTEQKFESDNLGLKGVVDEIRIYPDQLVPVELKTGKAPSRGVWPGHKIQIAAYMMMIEEKNAVPIKEGMIKYLDQMIVRPVILDPFIRKEILEIIKKIRIILKSSIPPMIKNINKCRACQLYEECKKLCQ